MLLDKDFVYDGIANVLNPAVPVHQLDAGYRSANNPADVERVRWLMEQYDVKEDFYFFTSCSKREMEICGDAYAPTGAMAAMATTINGINLIAFDMVVLEFVLENGMSFSEVVEHELIHIEQLESGRMRFEPGKVVWIENGVATEYPAEAINIMDPLMFDRSLAFQMALPWEAEAYAPEVSRGGNTQRAYAMRLGSELAGPARQAIVSGSRAVLDLVRWTELAMSLMIFKYRDYETADEQLGYMDLDENIHVRTNQMRDVVKSLMSCGADEFQAYCQRSC